MRKRWRLLPHDAPRIEQLMRTARVPAVLAQLLVSRGVYEADQTRQFLDARLSDLRDPRLLPGVPEAATRLHRAIVDRRSIVIHGDYDADGMTGTALLYNGLKLLGADVSYYLPNRLEEGYGLGSEALRRLAERGKELVVTVDCGISSVEQADLCRELGMQLIITDHHQLGERLPDADVLVHPRLPGTSYPFGELCGAGVAFKLAWALCQEACGAERVTERMRAYLLQAMGLAAIGTIADVVPLVDENRVLVRHGLRTLMAQPAPGMTELMRLTGLADKAALASEDVAFMLAPRLNAAGRLGQAQLAVELLTIGGGERAVALAEYLNQLNSSRESLERSVYLAAQKQAKTEFDPEGDPALVLCGTGWHLGVIGVVAGRLAEKYARPVLVISCDAVGGKLSVGSGRSGGRVDLHAALGECAERLAGFGGHRAAAGLKIDPDQIDAFRADFCEAVLQQLSHDATEPEILIDAEAALGQLTLETVSQIEQMAPFGMGNARPILCASGVGLVEPSRRMGGGDRHLTARLSQHGVTLRAVAFGQGEWCDELNGCEGPIDVAYRPVINDFRGRRNVELQIVDWRPALAPAAVAADRA